MSTTNNDRQALLTYSVSPSNKSKDSKRRFKKGKYATFGSIILISTYLLIAYGVGFWPFSSGDNIKTDGHVFHPNIIYILMDDLGFTEVGYNGAAQKTQTIDSLANDGIKLNFHYTETVCSATRSALLSGRYAWKTDVNFVVRGHTKLHLDINTTTISQELQKNGYYTLMTGKWHLGNFKMNQLPFNRGFDEALFFQSGGQKYYSHLICAPFSTFDNLINISNDLKNERNELFGDELCGYDLYDEYMNFFFRQGGKYFEFEI